MKKLKLNHDEHSIAGVFIGHDKLMRLHEKFEIIMNDDSINTISEKIALAIELYADTVEEAVGIGITIFGSILDSKRERSYPATESFKTRIEMEKRKIQNSIKHIADKLDIPATINDIPDDAIMSYLKNVDCNTCSSDGKCPIQDVASNRGLL